MGDALPRAAIHRVAEMAVEDMTREQLRALEKEWGSADALIPPSVMQLLRRAFTPRGVTFFEFYIKLRRIRLGEPLLDNLRIEYRRTADRLGMIRSPVDGQPLSPAAVNQIAQSKPLMERVLGAIQQGHEDDVVQWARLNSVFVPLLIEVAKDKGVYLRPTRQTGRERWAVFMKMSPKQERVERLRDDDPESYALMQQMGQALEIIDAGIEERIRAEGKEVKKSFLANRPVLLGVDPATGEEMVYDRDGEVLRKEDFFDKRRAQADAAARATRAPARTETPPKELRRLSDEELADLRGDVQWDAITDDKAKQGRLTRIFPTKLKPVFISDPEAGLRVEQQKVVVSGRYKGIFLDDLVNSEGRLIEGTAFGFDPKRGQTWRVPKKMDPSEREPYVTVAEVAEVRPFQGKKITVIRKKLYLKIDGTRQSKVLREAIKQLACNVGTQRGCIPSISYEGVEGSNAAGFYFEPKDFGVIMQSLQGMSLSKAALDEVKAYYAELARAEAATQQLDAYQPDALGSESDDGDETFHFVQGKRDPHTGEWRTFRLLKKQQQAVAWLDANGNAGVCALDTGIGKTTTSIAMMLKFVRDGLSAPDATYERPDGQVVQTNGRFLFVCPTSLKGNLPKEIRNFISDPRPLLDKVDVISYREFAGSSKSGKVPQSIKSIEFWKGRTWDPALYAAIFFDEAQEMKNPSSGSSKAALKLYHPRKVCLTASPMERNPMEAYVLAAITGNKLLFGRSPEASANRQEMKRFKERFCEVVGGRIVGVKQDPMVQRDLYTWVKRNVFYADKTEVDEYKLPTPVVETRAVEMHPEVETVYRDVAARFATILQGAARKFSERTRGDAYADKEAERIFSATLRPVIKLLTDLSNRPAKALEDIAFAIERGYLPGHVSPDGTPKELPRSLRGVIQAWAGSRSPDQLRLVAQQVGSPKAEAAADFIATKLERAHGSRSLVFADDKDLCLEAGMHLAKTVAGTHVVALDREIRFFRAGSELTELVYPLDIDLLRKLVKDPTEQDTILGQGDLVRLALPFVARAYRRYPMLPAAPKDNTHYRADNWQQFVLKEIVSPDPTIVSCTLLGKVYMYGHNLQAFNTVLHLDRNNWNSESMKQRTARAWRQGQEQVVEEVTFDTTYGASDGGVPRDTNDVSLDQIREAFQKMDADIFDSIIKAAQGIELGAEWESVAKKDASLWRLDRKVLELLASPFMDRSQPPGAR